MQIIALILLVSCHFLSGYGILAILGIRRKPSITIPLSLILGVAVASCIPFLLTLLYIRLTPLTVLPSLALACILLNIRSRGFRPHLTLPRFRIYELPGILIIGFLVFVSIWRCYYLPPSSRDALSGPEAIAEYAVREHTMINSFFRVDLFTTNNQFKSPFLTSLQIIYKMAGFPFGQVWLSIIFLNFIILLYARIKETLHPVIGSILLLLFIMTPETYGYTFMILYDYSNMVYFFLSLYFLFEFFSGQDGTKTGPDKDPEYKQLYFAGLLMGIATYVRSETLLIALLFLPLILFYQRRAHLSPGSITRSALGFYLPSFLAFLLTAKIFIRYYLPVPYDLSALTNDHPFDLRPLFQRMLDMIRVLLSGDWSVHLWGYFIYLFALVLLSSFFTFRKPSAATLNWLYAIIAVFLGLAILGWLLPLMNLTQTTKRGMFKILPLMLFFMINNQWLQWLSQWIYRWEKSIRS